MNSYITFDIRRNLRNILNEFESSSHKNNNNKKENSYYIEFLIALELSIGRSTFKRKHLSFLVK
jgi:hypothetical protein